MKLNWHRPRGSRAPVRRLPRRAPVAPSPTPPRPAEPEACARSAAALACVARQHLVETEQRFTEACNEVERRLQEIHVQTTTAPWQIRVERTGSGQVRVCVNGYLTQIFDLGITAPGFIRSPYENREG